MTFHEWVLQGSNNYVLVVNKSLLFAVESAMLDSGFSGPVDVSNYIGQIQVEVSLLCLER